jgi:hypothetical protein
MATGVGWVARRVRSVRRRWQALHLPVCWSHRWAQGALNSGRQLPHRTGFQHVRLEIATATAPLKYLGGWRLQQRPRPLSIYLDLIAQADYGEMMKHCRTSLGEIQRHHTTPARCDNAKVFSNVSSPRSAATQRRTISKQHTSHKIVQSVSPAFPIGPQIKPSPSPNCST